jgi:hypothetical protein
MVASIFHVLKGNIFLKFLLHWFKDISLFLVYLFIYSYIHALFGAPLPPASSPSPNLPCFQAGPVLPSSPILLKRRHKQ